MGASLQVASGGQRRRLDIVIGLIHEPPLVFLDEPTAGLDPQSRANLWGHIRELNSQSGTTVLMTTHYLDEADALSDRILVIDDGLIVAAGTPAELKRQVSGDAVRLTVARLDRSRMPRGWRSRCRERARPPMRARTSRSRSPMGVRSCRACLRLLDLEGIELTSVEVLRPSLDDVFLSLTGRSLRDAPEALKGPLT